MFNLAKHFSSYFSLVFANNEELKQEVFKIRYQVYCEELNYESINNFPEGMEIDDYDDRSLHFLLKHKPSNSYAGCVRVVLADWNKPQNNLPFENALSEDIKNSWNPNFRPQYCEISRLAVLAQFRRRQDEDTNPIGELLFQKHLNSKRETNQRKFPLIAFSLYWTSISVALELGIDIIALMEPRLARHLRSVGILSTSISDFFEYHGKRGVFLIKPPELLNPNDNDIKALFEIIREQIIDSISAEQWRELCQKIQKQDLLLPNEQNLSQSNLLCR